MKTEWWEEDGTPDPGIAWWAVEHVGHPAFYLRALMPGDFAPGRLPLSRHVITLDDEETDAVTCGTCGQAPASDDLEPIERTTGKRMRFEAFRARRMPWPPATEHETCWLCSSRSSRPKAEVQKPWGKVNMCQPCAKRDKQLSKERERREKREKQPKKVKG